MSSGFHQLKGQEETTEIPLLPTPCH